MEHKNMPLRDFVYLDGDRLHSLYSQAFEGVADKIIESYVDGLSRQNTQKGEPLSGTTLETQVGEISQRTENKLLYDHMYNRFEARLAPTLVQADLVSPDNYGTLLSDTFAIKVTGPVEIEDFNRMTALFDKFNDLGEAIAYAFTITPEAASTRDTLSQSIDAIQDRNQRAKAKEAVRHQSDPKKLAREMGLSQDPKLLSNLKLWSQLFAQDLFFVSIVPPANKGSVVFRAILNTKWLRVQPNQLRALYGIYPQCQWTLVGQVTHVPGLATSVSDSPKQDQIAQPPSNPPKFTMRDSYRNMFKSSSEFEKMFLESNERVEVIVFPLALYREYKVPNNS